ncbi:rCG57196 [Rattus norvegicus]|uniref:RCG57196 n=1 Tax=Rattus norvegicus TaxID=10116 RepID=A6KPK2_RAT|nr:rCG57196 [Rattus norvegicus]
MLDSQPWVFKTGLYVRRATTRAAKVSATVRPRRLQNDFPGFETTTDGLLRCLRGKGVGMALARKLYVDMIKGISWESRSPQYF